MSIFCKSFKYTLAAFVLVLAASLSPVVFGESDDAAEQKNVVENDSTCKMKAYTDPEVMASAMANPTKFMELVALMSNPQTAQNMVECGMDSSQWNEIMANMMNPTKLMAATGQFMNPQMYMQWMTAMMNPAFYQASMNAYTNPALYTQWMTAAMNPAYYMQPMQKMLDPKYQQETTAWMMDTNNFQKMFENMFQAPVIADATVAK